MDFQVFLLLGQDGVTNGAIYALLALALVLVFTVTRVIFIPQGEFIAFGALTLAALQAGKFPGTVWLLLAAGSAVAVLDGIVLLRERRFSRLPPLILANVGFPLACAALLWLVPMSNLPLWALASFSMLLVVPLGPMVYRIAFQPLASASTLVLLIVAVAVHLALIGLGLLMFGAEGWRTPAFTETNFEIAGAPLQGQTLLVILASAVLIVALYFFFERTIYGKAPDGDFGPHGRQAVLYPGCRDWCFFRHPGRAHYDHLLRFRFLDGPQGICRRHHWRSGLVSRCGIGRLAGRIARVLFLLLGERFQRGYCFHPHSSRPALAFSGFAAH